MSFFDERTVRVARTLFVLGLVTAFLYGARHTLIAFLFAIFLAYLLEPFVSRLQRWHRVSRGSRIIAIGEVYLVGIALLAALIFGVGPYIAGDARQLFSAIPSLLSKLGSGEIVQNIASKRGWSYETEQHLQSFLANHRVEILARLQALGLQVGSLVTQSFWLVVIPILAVLLLNSGGEVVDFGFKVMCLPAEKQRFARVVLDDINTMVAQYIRTQLVLVGLAIIAYTAVLVAFRVQYGLGLGVTAGILEFIPMVGPIIGAAMILGVAFLTGFHRIVFLIVFLGCWRLLQDYVTSPKLMHDSIRLHPLAVIFAILAGGEIGGVLGVFLSIPITATIQIILRRWQAQARLQEKNAAGAQIRAA